MSNFSRVQVCVVADSYLLLLFFGFLKEEKDLKNALVHICATWAFFKFPGPCIIVILY